MAVASMAASGSALASDLLAPFAPSGFPIIRVVVRALIVALIIVLLAYIVIEQVGSWRRRRSGRE